MATRIGKQRVREVRTVDVSRMLSAIAAENDYSKNTLQHVKSVLSGIFTFAKNEGAFDGANPVQGALLPSKAREAKETFAYDLSQILRILDVLPLLPKAVVATAAFFGLREGELRGQRHGNNGEPTYLEVVRQSTEEQGEPQFRSSDSRVSSDSGRVPAEHA